MTSASDKPTSVAYNELLYAYDYFNGELFDSQLPACLLTLQREKRSFGYFSRKRFISPADGATTDEIAINPQYFATGPIEEIMQTLVHEMTHLWQFHFGTPGRRGYHNKEWGAKMEAIGLMPSDTGQPGGKKCGESMADYIIEGGQFDQKCQALLTQDCRITWMDRFPIRRPGMDMPAFIMESFEVELAGSDGEGGAEGAAGLFTFPGENKSNRWKYQCPNCEINVWGKPNLNIRCGECDSVFIGTE